MSLLQLKNNPKIIIIPLSVFFLFLLFGCGGYNRASNLPSNKKNKDVSNDVGISHLELASEYFVEGNNALRTGDTVNALRYFETAFMLDTNSKILYDKVIEISMIANFPANAVRTIQRGRNLSQMNDDELRKLAAIFLRYHSYPEAFEAINAIKEKTKNDTIFIARLSMAENLAIMGAVYNARGEYDSALIALNKVLDMGIRTQSILFETAMAYERTGKFEIAEKHFKEILAANPKFALAANYLGYMWAEKGINLDEAHSLILQALAEDPDNGAYLDSYGWVLFQKGFYDEALPQLLRSAELITDDYVVYYHLGEVYLKLNNKKSALEYYKKANSFEENPDFDKIAEIISSLSK